MCEIEEEEEEEGKKVEEGSLTTSLRKPQASWLAGSIDHVDDNYIYIIL